MTYSTPIIKGKFLSRPNRFIAHAEVGGETVAVHVKNTGRCKELLVEGGTVLLAASDHPNRKTPYDLVAVEKTKADGSTVIVNMDSQAPNDIAAEYLPESGLFPKTARYRREITHGTSRFDFAVDTPDTPTAFLEVKGCTLERDGIAFFPDAPTERGVKHLNELTALAQSGHPAYILFIIQMKGITALRPNDETHPAFGEALRKARDAGVGILAVDCIVKASPDPDGALRLSVTADQSIPVEI